MSGFRFLNLVRPFLPILPEVSSPDRKVPFHQKVLWTAVTLLIFFGLFAGPPLRHHVLRLV